MKNYYQKRLIGRPLLLVLVLAISQSGFSQEDFPVPDQALMFDKNSSEWVTKVHDASGNDNPAYWWTYREAAETLYGGYRPDAGKFGGAWYISGYHICCEEMASPSMDFILLAGSNNAKKDAEGFNEVSPLYHKGFESLSVAFWFKSDRDYSLGHEPCPPDQVGMHEQELLFSMGSGTTLAIQNFKGYYEVRLGSKLPEQDAQNFKIPYLYDGVGAAGKEWQHIAVTFDGTNNGTLSFYIDGELATAYLGDPNPLETGLDSLPSKTGSVEIGAQTGGGPFGDVSDFWPGSQIGNYCLTAADTSYRTGWPAAGYFDEYVFYKNKVLSQAEIKQLFDNSIESLITIVPEDTASSATGKLVSPYRIYPNPARDVIRINAETPKSVNLVMYDILGSKILQREVSTGDNTDISMIPGGVYFIKIDNLYTSKILIQ